MIVKVNPHCHYFDNVLSIIIIFFIDRPIYHHYFDGVLNIIIISSEISSLQCIYYYHYVTVMLSINTMYERNKIT